MNGSLGNHQDSCQCLSVGRAVEPAAHSEGSDMNGPARTATSGGRT